MAPVHCCIIFLSIKLGPGKDLDLAKGCTWRCPSPNESMQAGLEAGVLDGVVGVRGVVGLGVVDGHWAGY